MTNLLGTRTPGLVQDRCSPYLSPRYPLWKYVVKRLPPKAKVLDLGCGRGQVGRLLGRRIEWYAGIDRSTAISGLREEMIPSLAWRQRWDLEQGLPKDLDIGHCRMADATHVLALDLFQYLENDIPLLSQLPRGATCIVSVMRRRARDAVRRFPQFGDVWERYGRYFDAATIATVRDWFILEGRVP